MMNEEGDIPSVTEIDKTTEPSLLQRISKIIKSTTQLTEENEALQLKVARLTKELEDKSGEIDRYKKELEDLKAKSDTPAVAKEEKQQKRADLETEITKNEQDIDQCNEEMGRYNREYLYNVRDLEKLLTTTECPLTSRELKDFGICRSQPQTYHRSHSRGSITEGGGGFNRKRQTSWNWQENRTLEYKRSQAFKSSNLSTRNAPLKKQSLSSVTANDGRWSFGGRDKSKWASGGGGAENRKEDRTVAIQGASLISSMGGQRRWSSASMKGETPSGTVSQGNSDDEMEQREKQEMNVTKRIVGDVGAYVTSEITLDEVRDEILMNTVGAEKFSRPSLQTVFKCFIAASIKKASPEVSAKYGHVLAYCLHKKSEERDNKGREEILKGVADGCRVIVEQEQWEDAPKIWQTVAEVLINALMPEEGLFVGGYPTLSDFKDSFLTSALDTRKPYTLFVLVLKRLAEMHYKRNRTSYMDAVSWVLDECSWIEKYLDVYKLDNALKETKMEFADNLHAIMRQDH